MAGSPTILRDLGGDPAAVRLALEAFRIRHAPHFDARLAVHGSRIEPLPHQVSAVYESMLPRRPLRFLLADDPGAGKTIMAGLFLKELLARGALARCLVVAPGSLVEQWQNELASRFDLRFATPSRADLSPARTGNWFAETPMVVARLDQLARDARTLQLLDAACWDLVVFDEAHRLAARWYGRKREETRRHRLARHVARTTRDLLLMSATPHNGKQDDFEAFMALLDPDRFEGRPDPDTPPAPVGDLLRRRVKEALVRFDGRSLFPPRRAVTVRFTLGPAERALYDRVTEYVREEFDRAESQGDARARTVGFALTVLQRRLASSPAAIHRSLAARRRRLADELERRRGLRISYPDVASLDEEDLDDLLDESDAPTELVEGASAARSEAELADEVARLESLERGAEQLLRRSADCKWEALAKMLQHDASMRDSSGRRRKLVIFSEHKDTLTYVAERVRVVLGRDEAVVTLDGSMSRPQRLAAQEAFTTRDDVEVLVATDAAGEGINLQRASLVINYDLPWSPTRLEQRFGRVHRIGQEEVCVLWNLVAQGTREATVFEALCRKLEEASGPMQGQVFDVLGAAFTDKPLRELLVEALRGGRQEAPRLAETVTQALDGALTRQTAPLGGASSGDSHSERARLAGMRAEMARARASQVGCHAVGPWALAACAALGVRAHPRGGGLWRAGFVPESIRARLPGAPVSIAAFGFDPARVPPGTEAWLLTPGHAALTGLLDAIEATVAGERPRESVLVDPFDPGTRPWWCVAARTVLRDGTGETLDAPAWQLRLDDDGTVTPLGGAFSLDLRAPEETEREAVESLARDGSEKDFDARTREAIERHVVAPVLQSFAAQRRAFVDGIERAALSRLTREILSANREAEEARARSRGTEAAAKRAAELRARLFDRRELCNRLREVSADPVQIDVMVRVVPGGALGVVEGADLDARAFDIVAEWERERDRVVSDERASRHGWDLASLDAHSGDLRLRIVRGVREDGTSVRVRRSEALALAHAPDVVSVVVVPFDGEIAGVPIEVRDPRGLTEMHFQDCALTWKLENAGA